MEENTLRGRTRPQTPNVRTRMVERAISLAAEADSLITHPVLDRRNVERGEVLMNLARLHLEIHAALASET